MDTWEPTVNRLREVARAEAVTSFADAWEVVFEALSDLHDGDDPLTALLLLRVLREDLDAIVVPDLVRACREREASWGDIGHALGVTRQSARARFREAD